MAFNSLAFLSFFLAFWLLWNIIADVRKRWIFLSLASLLFYSWESGAVVFALLATAVVDYYCGLKLATQRKQSWLLLSVTSNLSLLGYFKYFHTGAFPIGISFYTFQSLSYVLDLYRGQGLQAQNFWHYLSFVSMFPQLVAGPICRARDLLNQLQQKAICRESATQLNEGFHLIVRGYLKKVFLADHLGALINPLLDERLNFFNSGSLWLIFCAFGWQLLFDFSGYTDIARGLGKWLGYELPENFSMPYKAASLTSFWRHWHKTLSSWFRDYVYIPLGGGRSGMVKGSLAIGVTFVLSGLWHGNSLNFLFWGLFHGAIVVLEKVFKLDFENEVVRSLNWLNILRTYLLTTFSWVLFRIEDMELAKTILKKMLLFESHFQNPLELGKIAILVGVSFVMEFFIFQRKTSLLITLIFLILVIFFRASATAEFIYFRF